MSKFRLAALALALVAPTTAAFADTVQVSAAADSPKVNQLVTDASGRRIGRVYSISSDKSSVAVINDMRIVNIPVATLTSAAKGLQTSLTLANLR